MYVHFEHMSLLGNFSSLKQSVTGLKKTLCQSVFTLETPVSKPNQSSKFIDENGLCWASHLRFSFLFCPRLC